MKEYDRLNDAISNIIEETRQASVKDNLKVFAESGRLDKFEEQFEDFKQDVQRAAEDCDRAITSPIYVGVVGHYSHGKSSLLNAMLFPQTHKELLPTGESIVTAMCTLVGFKNDRQGHEFREIKHDGIEIRISPEEYRSKVSGKKSGTLQNVHHFSIRLNTSELNPGVFQSMAEKNIELLDTPGLGGPYWKDEHALQSWIKEFMLLIVSVKSDAINKRVADTVNPFLKHCTRPIIPVVTFWDLWHQSEAYKGINSEEDAREAAKSNLIRYFPAMSDAVEDGRVIFVSAKNYRDKISVSESPNSPKEFFTEEWNIDSVRSSLTNYVANKVSILRSIRNEQSDLDIHRKRNVIDSCRSLCSTYVGLNAALRAELEASRPRAAYEEDLDEAFEKLRDEINREYERILDRIAQKVEDRVGTISVNGNLSQQLNEISKDIKADAENIIKDSLPERLSRTLDRGVIRTISRYLDNDGLLTKAKSKRLQVKIKEICHDLVDDLSKPKMQNPFVAPQGVTDWAKNMSSALFDGMKTLFTANLPLGLMILGAIFVLPPMIGTLNGIPFVGEKLAGAVIFIQVLVFAAGALTLIAVSWGNMKRAREKTAIEVKEKARKQNRRSDIHDRIIPDILTRQKDFEDQIRDTLAEAIDPLIRSGDDMSEEIDRLFSDIGTQVRIIEKECSALARGVR
ncbi:hypothetical protein CKO25_11145 [Thiocapsa imhoffii]|uniref:Dynamin N-terminal domain-containing protein n=1 Tax=Thiocapsa imhoffii TaxID=382777 RepID=A0A9X0WIL0_9GAMM|nr:dynamin family protein [Thiocapsa imhoffii]MBK1645191.1 hypothetical protein [Thiocapsa imhoffii]